ncbi:MAG: sigma-54-dependent Fis family transcriptional regulator [Nitrospirae bacterium]|nr:sigma-54-dependent Fis family transcriptional regulator [Nitrospirota bacterium]
MSERLLIVEDEEVLCESLRRVLQREGYIVDTVGSAEAALEIFDEGFYDLIITDIILPGITGIELLKKIKDSLPEQIVVIMTAYASLETAVEALRAGAYDYVVKPIMHEEMKQIVKNALRQGALQEENVLLRKQLWKQYDLSKIIGVSPEMRKVIGEVRDLAAGRKNIFIAGEIGTGKELIARAIHITSAIEKPFIPVSLGSLPEEEMDVRLFGFVKGAYKEAQVSRKGIFEKANGGTVFFREIADLTAGLQQRLLNVMKSGELTPVGSRHPIKADIRFISASNTDIEAAIRAGRFSGGLFELINGSVIKLPPLRERREDIRPLVDYFLGIYSADLSRPMARVDDAVLELFEKYHWPGNIRELRNVIERAVLISSGGKIERGHITQLFEDVRHDN